MVRFIIAGHLQDIYHFFCLLFVLIKDLIQDVLYLIFQGLFFKAHNTNAGIR